MAKDFLGKQPTKNEKMFYELVMQQDAFGRDLWTTSANVISLGILLKVDPVKIAELLVDDTQIKEYAQKINAAIRELQDAKNAEAKKTGETAEAHDHANHDHNHADHGHQH